VKPPRQEGIQTKRTKRLSGCYDLGGGFIMALSARNQLPGKIKEIHLGEIMARVVVKVGSSLVESVITRTSAEELGLKKGDSVRVVVKSTEVMIQKD
jgi:molybdopterin-binding protein